MHIFKIQCFFLKDFTWDFQASIISIFFFCVVIISKICLKPDTKIVPKTVPGYSQGKQHPQRKPQRLQRVWKFGYLVHHTSNQLLFYKRFLNTNKIKKKKSSYRKNSILCDRVILNSPFYLSRHWLLIGQFCTEMMPFQS